MCFFKRKFKNNCKEFTELPSLFNKLNENNCTYVKIIECLQQLYKESAIMPHSEHAFQRDLCLSFKISELFKDVEQEIVINNGRLDILLIT